MEHTQSWLMHFGLVRKKKNEKDEDQDKKT